MKFENTEVFNFEGALRGMRNPMNSWVQTEEQRDFLLEKLNNKYVKYLRSNK